MLPNTTILGTKWIRGSMGSFTRTFKKMRRSLPLLQRQMVSLQLDELVRSWPSKTLKDAWEPRSSRASLFRRHMLTIDD